MRAARFSCSAKPRPPRRPIGRRHSLRRPLGWRCRHPLRCRCHSPLGRRRHSLRRRCRLLHHHGPPQPRPRRVLYLGGRGQGSRMGRARFVALRFPKNTEMYQKIADPRSAATRERTRPAVLQSPRSAMPTPKGEKPDSSIHFVTFWESIPSISRTNPAAASEKRHAFHLRSAKPRHSTQRNKAAPPHEKTDRRQDAPLRSKPLDRACSDRACACERNRLRPADHPAVESLGRPLSSLAASPINHD